MAFIFMSCLSNQADRKVGDGVSELNKNRMSVLK